MKLLSRQDKYTLDREIERILKQMSTMSVDSEEYQTALATVKTLSEANGIKSHKALSTDTIVSVAGNLIGILLVLNFERMNVVTSKAFGFIGKGSKGA